MNETQGVVCIHDHFKADMGLYPCHPNEASRLRTQGLTLPFARSRCVCLSRQYDDSPPPHPGFGISWGRWTLLTVYHMCMCHSECLRAEYYAQVVNFSVHVFLVPHSDEELASFPVDASYLKAIRQRVSLATQLHSLEHQRNKVVRAEQWLSKSAKAMDIEVDEELYPGHTCSILS